MYKQEILALNHSRAGTHGVSNVGAEPSFPFKPISFVRGRIQGVERHFSATDVH
jgi:hypothetical protein